MCCLRMFHYRQLFGVQYCYHIPIICWNDNVILCQKERNVTFVSDYFTRVSLYTERRALLD